MALWVHPLSHTRWRCGSAELLREVNNSPSWAAPITDRNLKFEIHGERFLLCEVVDRPDEILLGKQLEYEAALAWTA